jgi:DNA-binding transcriptional regulator YiaG
MLLKKRQHGLIKMDNQKKIESTRKEAGLTTKQAAALVGVTTVTWQRWEGQTSRATEIPYAHWNLFLFLTGRHPVYGIVKK